MPSARRRPAGYPLRPRSALRRTAIRACFFVPILILALPPRHANAEIFTAIAITASVLSTLVSLGDSGANPYGEMTAQNHRSLKIMHKRLDGYDRAFKAILKKLDALPKEIRKEIDDAFVDDRIVKVRSAVNLIVEDIKVFKKLRDNRKQNGGPELTPIADANIRLSLLQTRVSDLLQAEDDLVVFDLIAARYVEQAVIAMQPGIEGETDWSVRKERYRQRFERVFSNRWRKSSLPWRYFEARNDGNAFLQLWDRNEIEPAIKNPYTSVTRQYTNCESEIIYSVSETANRVHINMNERDELGTDRLRLIRSYDSLRSFYKYAIEVVQFEKISLMSDPPKQRYPKLELLDGYEVRFLELREAINTEIAKLPANRFLFRRPPNQHCM